MGWFTASATRTGRLNLSGSLGDGTAFTTSLEPDLMSQPGFRIFVQPYRPARTHSWIGGQFHLGARPEPSVGYSQDGVDLMWRKTGLQPDASYRDGFGPLTTRISLHPWQPPTRLSPLAMLLDTQSGQWQVWHDPTGSPSGSVLPTLVGLLPNNRLQVLTPLTTPTNIRRWQAVVQPRTGVFQGSFELLDPGQARRVPFNGVLRQVDGDVSDVIGAGRDLLPPLRTTTNGQIQSGAVRFSRE